MKQIQDIFKKAQVLIILEIVLGVVIGAAVILLVAVPSFSSWRKNVEKSVEVKQRLSKVVANINNLRGVDKTEFEELEKGFETLLPQQPEVLKFFTLAQKAANASGVSFSAAQVDLSKKAAVAAVAPAAPSAPTGGSKPSLGDGQAASSNPPGASTTPKPTVSTVEVKLSFSGTFPNLVKLLDNFDKTERAALVTELSFTSSQSDDTLTVSITFTLPAASAQGAVDAETVNLLTNQEIEELKGILNDISITAGPANNPTGRADPFR